MQTFNFKTISYKDWNFFIFSLPGFSSNLEDGEFIVITFVWQNIWSWIFMTFNIILFDSFSQKKKNILEKIFQSRHVV